MQISKLKLEVILNKIDLPNRGWSFNSYSGENEQILGGKKRVYKIYLLKVTGKQDLGSMKQLDLKLAHFIDYNPVFDKAELDIFIAKATPNLSKIEM